MPLRCANVDMDQPVRSNPTPRAWPMAVQAWWRAVAAFWSGSDGGVIMGGDACCDGGRAMAQRRRSSGSLCACSHTAAVVVSRGAGCFAGFWLISRTTRQPTAALRCSRPRRVGSFPRPIYHMARLTIQPWRARSAGACRVRAIPTRIASAMAGTRSAWAGIAVG